MRTCRKLPALPAPGVQKVSPHFQLLILVISSNSTATGVPFPKSTFTASEGRPPLPKQMNFWIRPSLSVFFQKNMATHFFDLKLAPFPFRKIFKKIIPFGISKVKYCVNQCQCVAALDLGFGRKISGIPTGSWNSRPVFSSSRPSHCR